MSVGIHPTTTTITITMTGEITMMEHCSMVPAPAGTRITSVEVIGVAPYFSFTTEPVIAWELHADGGAILPVTEHGQHQLHDWMHIVWDTQSTDQTSVIRALLQEIVDCGESPDLGDEWPVRYEFARTMLAVLPATELAVGLALR